MAFDKGRKKCGAVPRWESGRPRPARLPGGRLEPNLVVSVRYIFNIADRTEPVFREPAQFLISQECALPVSQRDKAPDGR